MISKHMMPLILLCAACFILTFSACSHQNKYQPSSYTKEEIQCVYQENVELFESIVKIISSNEMFYEKGRINEYTDADIVSPYDDALSFFSNTYRKTIDEFFGLKPYMILYDYACRFVEITFLAADTNDSYTFLFWTLDGEDSEDKFNDYKELLAQKYVLENITSRCIMFYGVATQ